MSPSKSPTQVARFLGWFSIGLGLTELIGGKALARLLGTYDSVGLLRGFGLREIAAGIGILQSPEPKAGWLWGRVAGDALDIATLEAALHERRSNKANVAMALSTVIGVTALDVWCAYQLSHQQGSVTGR